MKQRFYFFLNTTWIILYIFEVGKTSTLIALFLSLSIELDCLKVSFYFFELIHWLNEWCQALSWVKVEAEYVGESS